MYYKCIHIISNNNKRLINAVIPVQYEKDVNE